jgi:hypothetical protein
MKFSMIVLMTSCEPKRALRTPGMLPQNAPAAIAARQHSGRRITAGRVDELRDNRVSRIRRAKLNSHPRRRERGHIELAFRTDI